MDYFAEQMIKRKKGGKEKAIAAVIILACLALTACVLFAGYFLNEFLRMVIFLVAAAAWFFGIRLIQKQNVEYEYVFTNGELEIDVIYARSARKPLTSVRVADITFCARMDDERYDDRYANVPKNLHVVYAGSNTLGAKVYYADYLFNAEHTRLLFEPNDKILKMMAKYNPKRIHIYEEEK